MTLRERLGDVIFETDTPAARGFDVALLWAIVSSVLLVLLDSVADVRARRGGTLRVLEWTFTILFTVEYAARIWTARRPLRYVRSFYGVIDALRLLRVFRILEATRYLGEAAIPTRALRASREKITVFLVTVLTVVLILGYAIIAVPTGIVTTEISRASSEARGSQVRCTSCSASGHAADAVHCRICGEAL